MNMRNTSGYYRRNNYRKRKWRNILIISAISLAVLLVVFLVAGNILKKKTQDDNNGADETSVTDNTVIPAPIPQSINGYFIDLSGLSYTEFSNQISTFSSNGATAISLNLTDNSGNLLYDSKTAQKLGYQTTSSSLISLSSIITKTGSSGIYTSAYITLTAFKETDAKIRSVKLAYEAALVCEIAEAGFNDIIVRCPEISPEYIEELMGFAKNVKNINNNANIGIAFTKSLLEAEDSALYVDKLVSVFNLTALDLANVENNNILTYLEESFSNSNIRYYILRFNTRILLPYITDEETDTKIKTLLNENSINNWQIVK